MYIQGMGRIFQKDDAYYCVVFHHSKEGIMGGFTYRYLIHMRIMFHSWSLVIDNDVLAEQGEGIKHTLRQGMATFLFSCDSLCYKGNSKKDYLCRASQHHVDAMSQTRLDGLPTAREESMKKGGRRVYVATLIAFQLPC